MGGMGLICIILYKGMENSMADMAESFATMGTFSDAFGMSTLSIATLKGYFATEIGTIHALGSSMFAASIATVILSKEEDGHTAEIYVYTSGFTGQGNSNEVFCSATKPYLFYIDLWHSL